MLQKTPHPDTDDPPGGANDDADALRRLLSDGAVLDQYGEPVALIAKDGTILAANRAASVMLDVFGDDRSLAAAVDESIRTGAAVKDMLAREEAPGAARSIEVTVLPLEHGAAALVLGRDVSMEQSLRAALVESRRRYRDLTELSSDFAWETDAGGGFAFVSSRGAMGYDADELVRRQPGEFLDPSVQYIGSLPFGTRTPVSDVDLWCRGKDGTSVCLQTSAVPLVDHGGIWTGARGVCRDVTRVRGRDAALARAQTRKQLLAHVIRSVRDEIDPSAMLEAAASATAHALGGRCCRIYRLRRKEGFQLAAEFGVPTIDAEFEAPLLARARSGMDIVAAVAAANCVLSAPTIYQREVNGAILIARRAEDGMWDEEEQALAGDVAGQLAIAFEQIENHAALEALSRTDELTGLLNRRAFYAELRERLSRAAAGALFFVDLDNFKLVNDTHGHQRGDEALVAVSDLLKRATRPGDMVSRLGGDEFALWLERMDKQSAIRRAEELIDTSGALTVFSGDPTRPLGLSVGIAVHDPDLRPETVTGLTDRADAAMYRIKHGAKGGYVLADDTTPVPRESRA